MLVLAHLEKYKRVQVAPMIRHYERTMDATLDRSNIDGSRTHLNYEIGDTDQPHIDMEDLIAQLVERHNASGRAIRSDAVVMADLVITLPKGFPEDRAVEFFAKAADFAEGFWAPAICPQGYVHMDESQPHMHLPLIPFDEEAQRFHARDIITRTRLRQMHGQMEQYLRRELGMERVGVELTKRERGERELKYTDLGSYQNAKDELARAKQEASQERARAQQERSRADANAERARIAAEEARNARVQATACQEAAEAWAEQARTGQAEAEGWGQRADQARQACEQEQQRLEGLRRACGEQEAEIGRLDRAIAEAERERAPAQGVGPRHEPAPEPAQPERGLRALAHLAKREMGEGGGLGEREREASERARGLEEPERKEAERAGQLELQLGGARERLEALKGEIGGIDRRARDVERAVEELRERVRAALDRLVERLRELGRIMGLDDVSERLERALDDSGMEQEPPGFNEAVARGLGDRGLADCIAPRAWEYGYEEPECEYEPEYDAPAISRDLGWER